MDGGIGGGREDAPPWYGFDRYLCEAGVDCESANAVRRWIYEEVSCTRLPQRLLFFGGNAPVVSVGMSPSSFPTADPSPLCAGYCSCEARGKVSPCSSTGQVGISRKWCSVVDRGLVSGSCRGRPQVTGVSVGGKEFTGRSEGIVS